MDAFGKKYPLRMLIESVSQCSKVLNAVSVSVFETIA